MADPVDIAAHRRKMAGEASLTLWRDGEVFEFAAHTFNPEGFGVVGDDVVMVLDEDAKAGISVSKADAMRISAALINAAVGAPEV